MNFDHLRKLLIQKALEGKLVPQLDSEQKVAQGELTENALQEIPFNIPEKWKWFKQALKKLIKFRRVMVSV